MADHTQAAPPEPVGILPNKLYFNQVLRRMLTGSIAGGRLCHAYLFYGDKGVGKRTIALWFAAAILCRSKGDRRPCGECPSCRKFHSSNHPDLYLYDGKTGANSIHIETIRALRQDAYVLPNESDYKVYVLPNAEDMSISAANALLKVLEEPPSHAVFLLTANNRDAVPETIRSRCIMQEVYPIPLEELTAALGELLPDKPSSEVAAAAGLSNGILGRAIDILTNEGDADLGSLAMQIAHGMGNLNEYEILAALQQAASSRERMSALLERLSSVLRAALWNRLSVRSTQDGQIAELSFRLTLSQLERTAALLENARRSIDGNANLGLLANYIAANLMCTLA